MSVMRHGDDTARGYEIQGLSGMSQSRLLPELRDSMTKWKRFTNRQFAYWMLVAIPLWVASVVAVEALRLDTFWAFTAGALWSVLTTPIRDWLLDWRYTTKEVRDVSP